MQYEKLDNMLLKSYANIGRLYQETTGKSKNDLAVKLYCASSVAFAWNAVYSIPSSVNSTIDAAIGSNAANETPGPFNSAIDVLLCLNYGNEAIQLSRKKSLTENIPSIEMPIFNNFNLFIGIIATYLTTSSLASIAVSYATNDYSNIKHDVSGFMFGMSCLMVFSAHYLARVDIGPPSGKTLMSRVKDYVKSHLPGPILQPSPSPVPA